MARYIETIICVAAVVGVVYFFSTNEKIDFGASTLPSIKYAVIKVDPLLELPGECGFNAAGLDLSSSSSDDNFEGKMTDIPGVCSFIVPNTGDRTGCCFKDRALRFEPPDLHKDVYRLGVTGTTSCSSDCLTRYISFWCFFSCSGFNVTEDAICSEPITKLYEACAIGNGRCNILRSEGISGIAAWRQAKQLTFAPPNTTDCADFGSWGYRCIETAVPTVDAAAILDNGAGDIADSTITIQATSFTDYKKINYKFNITNKLPFVAPGAPACSKNLFPTKGELTLEKDSVNLGTIKFDSFKFVRIAGTDDKFTVLSPELIVAWVNGPGEYRYKFRVWNTFGASTEKSGSFHVVVSALHTVTAFPDIFVCDLVEGAKKGLLPADGVFTGMPTWTPFLLPFLEGSTECPAPYVSTPAACASDPNLCCTTWPRSGSTANKVNAGRVICCDEDQDYDTIGRRCHIQADINTVWIKPQQLDSDEDPKFRTRITSTKLSIREDMPINGLVQLISSEIKFDEDTPTFLRVPSGDSNTKHAATIEGDAGSLISLDKNGKLIVTAKLFFSGDVRVEAGAQSLIAAAGNGRIVLSDNSSLAVASADVSNPAHVRLQGGQSLLDTQIADLVLFTVESQARPFCSLELEGNVIVEKTISTYGDTTYADATPADQDAAQKPRIIIVRGKACVERDPALATIRPQVGASILINRTNEAAAQLDDRVQPENEWTEEVDALHKKGARQAVIDTALQCCGAICGDNIDVQDGGAVIIGSTDAGVECSDPGNSGCSATATGDVTVGPKGTLIFENVDSNTLPFCADTFAFSCANGACPTVQILLGENIGPDPTNINLMKASATAGECTDELLAASLPRILVVNQQTGRQVVLKWADVDGVCTLQAVVPQAPPPQAPSTAAALFLSNYEYCVYMALPATELTADEFKEAIEKNLGISRDRLQPFAFYGSDSDHNNDLLARFKCNDLSASNAADATCRVITNAALDEGSAFQLAVKATGTCENLPARTDEGSRTALFGLFGLMAIPILCILAICLLLKRHKRNADNQYMQDTATFSNVAAAPQAIAYTIPQGYKEPVVAYSAPAGFVEPPPPYY